MLLAGEWLRLSSIWVRGWIQQVLAVLLVVEREAKTKGVINGELRGGGGFGSQWGLGHLGLPIKLKQWGAPNGWSELAAESQGGWGSIYSRGGRFPRRLG